MGMSYDQYWYGDMRMQQAYAEADRIRQERWLDQTNYAAWLQGQYIFYAISLALGNAFGKGTPQDYLDKPFEIKRKSDEESEREREQKKREEEEIAIAEAYMLKMKNASRYWGTGQS